MASKPLLIVDFDGVIVDGLCEYWWSSRRACLELLGKEPNSSELPKALPKAFKELRPWVHQGWEMVLIAGELLRVSSALNLHGTEVFSKNYKFHCQEALEAWQWKPEQLQKALEHVRKEAINNNPTKWLANHSPFPDVVERLNQLEREKIEFAVLTTKSTKFTAHLLKDLQLKPSLLYGHEAGTKPEVLLKLLNNWVIQGFLEDRRSTLETVLQTPGLTGIPCYLAGWGYLKPEDKQDLPAGIHLLNRKTLATPLAMWP